MSSALAEIVINGRFLAQRVTGVQRYALESLLALDRLVASGEGAFARWTLVVPRSVETWPALSGIAVERCGAGPGHLWEQSVLGWRARRAWLLSFGFTGPLLLRRQVVTVHDGAVARFPQAYRRAFRWTYRALMPWLVRRAAHTVAVSRFAAGEARDCFGAPASRLMLGTEGWQHLERVPADEAVLDAHGLRGQPFVLAVSSPSRNKNFAAIAKALALLGPAAPLCAVAGAIDDGVFRAAGLPADGSRLRRLGYVSDGELRALYEHARCFVMPSYYEGFGIPVIEAMASGCPVVASTAEALREVGGEAALYFEPDDAATLASHLMRLASDDRLTAQLREVGRRRAQHYTWDANARLHLGLMRRLIPQSPSTAPTHPMAKGET